MYSPTSPPRVTTFLLPVLVLSLSVLLAGNVLAAEPQTELLWPEGAPGALGERPEDKPTLIVYLPEKEKATGAAVCVCPGGGYGHLAMDHEGDQIGRWFNAMGVAGFIVDYRHRRKGYGHPAPLQDAQRAIRTVRARGAEWGVRPDRIGVMGFSAGGHLASTAATHFDAGRPDAEDPIERASCRPDFAILYYPVVMFDEAFTHRGSQRNLLGENPDPELVRSLSNEKQVTPETPPTFLFHTDEDTGVPAENSVQFYLALRRAKVPAELHVYRQGRHGLGLAPDVPGTGNWPKQCEDWMRGLGLLEK
ncbi:MAG TPA: alpha/beta hydrolase [Thermoguttaceae bacterium]|nr:alpha/beta hydrolase [Thermoguttaceae bacterium]